MKQYIKKGGINEEYSACKFTLQQQKKTTEEETPAFRGRRITFIQTNDVRCGNMGLKKVKKHTQMFESADSELCGWRAAKEKDKKG